MRFFMEIAAAVVGTISFSLLFSVPTRYYPYCGLIGGIGWFAYSLLTLVGCSAPVSSLFATVIVILLSRACAVRAQCPVTIFLIAGIFPLVPGAGIYWTTYYIVMNKLELALQTGFGSLKVAAAIVMGIVFVFELPQSIFRIFSPRHPGQNMK